MPKIIDSAMRSLDAGLAVFPAREGGKDPACRGGCRDATRSRDRVIRHWRQHPSHNYGIATGKASEIFVVDIDGSKGEASLRALCAKYSPLPPTVTVITANGRHLYFRTGGVVVGSSTGKLGPDLDVRGDGGYVIGAGSVHPSGQLFRYADGHDPESMPIAM